MNPTDYEKVVQDCYSTWGKSYYEEYYGEKAPYPPVHREIVKNLLRENKVKTLLDAGCGPASFLREVVGSGIELFGFDLTSEMVEEGKRIFAQNKLNPENIWQGSILEKASFTVPGKRKKQLFDSVVCFGVMPHIPPEEDIPVFDNLASCVKKGGKIIVEARNQLFSLFTVNRYSYEFLMNDLIPIKKLKENAGTLLPQLESSLDELKKQFRMDLPPIRKGKQGEPGYDEILSRTHNPLVMKQQLSQVGLKNIQTLFYHYHCLPPMIGSKFQEYFLKNSIAMENPDDWRGYFMSSAFIMVGTK